MQQKISYYFIIIILFLAGCDINSFNQNGNELSQEETLLAGLIIGESVSENQSGLLSSFQEAFAIPMQQNLVTGPSLLSSDNFRDLDNYTYNFDATTGKHHVTFSRSYQGTELTSISSYQVYYIFWDSNNNIISNPDSDRERIETVEYKAIRSGEILDSTKVSNYQRIDHLFMNGISEQNDMLIIDGYHSGKGNFTRIDSLGHVVNRDYLIDINYLDIRINKPVVLENRNFRTGVTGAFSYETTIRLTGNGIDGTKIVNGSIELNGDGTALLTFGAQNEPYRVRLGNGGVIERDEFEGRVISVDNELQIFTLVSGIQIQINEDTKIFRRDFNSLDEVSIALQSGIRIIAEGKLAQVEPGSTLQSATQVQFELESDEFDDLLASVNLVTNSFTLESGEEYFVIQRSLVRYNGKVTRKLDVILSALLTGKEIEVEGEFDVDVDTGRRLVKKAEFESEDDDDDDDEEENDDEEEEDEEEDENDD